MPVDNERLMVCPIVPVREGDFLGIFAGKIHFSDRFDPVHGIQGPSKKLWLDYSRAIGVLNQMRVLQMYACNEEDEIQSNVSWRVSVRALRPIALFQETSTESSAAGAIPSLQISCICEERFSQKLYTIKRLLYIIYKDFCMNFNY